MPDLEFSPTLKKICFFFIVIEFLLSRPEMKRQLGRLNEAIKNLEMIHPSVSVLLLSREERFERDNLHLQFSSAIHRFREMNSILNYY